MDVVYVVRPGDRNEELRYSLRSLRNLSDVGQIWIAGHCPAWVDRDQVRFVPVEQRGTRFVNSTANLRAVLEADDGPEEFIYFNDDFFVTRPMDRVPVLTRGSARRHLLHVPRPLNSYVAGLEATVGLLAELGHDDPAWFELHTPMVIRSAGMLEALGLAALAGLAHPHKRTLYGNLAGLTGPAVPDCKLHEPSADPWPLRGFGFLSTATPAFRYGLAGRWVRQLFPEPSPFERAGPGWAERRRQSRAQQPLATPLPTTDSVLP